MIIHAVNHVAVENMHLAGDNRIREALHKLWIPIFIQGQVIVDRYGADLNHHRGAVISCPICLRLLNNLKLHRIITMIRKPPQPKMLRPNPRNLHKRESVSSPLLTLLEILDSQKHTLL